MTIASPDPDPDPDQDYSIGELADITGLSVHTLRWYESRGLFPRNVPRTSGSRRTYGPETVG